MKGFRARQRLTAPLRLGGFRPAPPPSRPRATPPSFRRKTLPLAMGQQMCPDAGATSKLSRPHRERNRKPPMRYLKNIIGPRVRKLREQRAWSLDQLAAEFARQGILISPRTLERVEKQQSFVGSIEVCEYAAVFHTSVEYLFPSYDDAMEALSRAQLLRQSNGATKSKGRNGGF
jgi:transcriptional regulator with XRE-family HTH domain